MLFTIGRGGPVGRGGPDVRTRLGVRGVSGVRGVRGAASVLLGALACAMLAVLGSAAPAAAHAALTGSTPADGSVVHSAPHRVTLTFSEGVSMSEGSIRVLDPSGKRVDTSHVRDAGSGKAVRLKSGLAKGTYTVAWHAVSADTHPVSGAFTFSVGAPSRTSAHVPRQDEGAGGGPVGVAYGVGRYAAYAGLVLLVGGGAFVLFCWSRAARVRAVQRLVVAGWLTLTASTLLLLLLRNSYTGSGELADVLDPGGLSAAVATKPGTALLSRLLLAGGAALFLAALFGTYGAYGAYGRPGADAAREGPDAERQSEEGADEQADQPAYRKRRFVLGAVGALLAAGLTATWSMAEHASTGPQYGLAIPVDMVHLLTVSLWAGGLAALLTSLYAAPAALPAAVVRRFSRVAFGSVLVLVATGLYQAWRQVGYWSALTGTSYGQLLLAKAALVALLVAVAGTSRRWTARLPDGRSRSRGSTEAAQAEPAQGLVPEPSPEPGAESVGAEPVGAEPAGAESEADSAQEHAQGHAQGSARTAQLARQRAAVDAARRKKARDAEPARAGLRRSVLAEAAVAVVVLAVTSVLTDTEPGRTEHAAAHAPGAHGAAPHHHAGPARLTVPFDTGGPHGKGTARLRISPGRSGDNTVRLTTTALGGKPLDAPEVRVALSLPDKKLGPLRVALHPVKGERGQWRARGVQVPMPGRWRTAVTVRTSDIDEVTENRKVTID